jgi:hypothetical protein
MRDIRAPLASIDVAKAEDRVELKRTGAHALQGGVTNRRGKSASVGTTLFFRQNGLSLIATAE